MTEQKKSADEAAKAVHDALEKLLDGHPESAIAKAVIIAASLATGMPWFVAAEPVVQRLLERINNKAGKDAVAEIAAEVETEDGYRKVAAEVSAVIRPTLAALFSEQMRRGSIDAGQSIDIIGGNIADAVARIGILLHRMEDRIASSTGLRDSEKPLAGRLVLTGPTMSMRALAPSAERIFDEVRAVPFGGSPRLILELTNLSAIDVRPVAIYVDVVECLPLEVQEVWLWYGMMRPLRKYEVHLEARTGRYRCSPKDESQDAYLALASGELEVFSVDVALPAVECFYAVSTVVEFSWQGSIHSQGFDRVVQFGAYDPQRHTPVRDHRRMNGPPPQDGGDNCVRDAQAAALATAVGVKSRD